MWDSVVNLAAHRISLLSEVDHIADVNRAIGLYSIRPGSWDYEIPRQGGFVYVAKDKGLETPGQVSSFSELCIDVLEA